MFEVEQLIHSAKLIFTEDWREFRRVLEWCDVKQPIWCPHPAEIPQLDDMLHFY